MSVRLAVSVGVGIGLILLYGPLKELTNPYKFDSSTQERIDILNAAWDVETQRLIDQIAVNDKPVRDRQNAAIQAMYDEFTADKQAYALVNPLYTVVP